MTGVHLCGRVRAGATANGHPTVAGVARIMTTLLARPEDRGRFGLQTMGEAGGLANVTSTDRRGSGIRIDGIRIDGIRIDGIRIDKRDPHREGADHARLGLA